MAWHFKVVFPAPGRIVQHREEVLRTYIELAGAALEREFTDQERSGIRKVFIAAFTEGFNYASAQTEAFISRVPLVPFSMGSTGFDRPPRRVS